MAAASSLPVALLLLGPTASGKSALALELADEFGCEIVSVDSAQVYRGMDVGTAKPGADVLARMPHHLIDLIDPTESYSAARFRDDALAAMAAISARGRLPLLAGGTMLYFKALRSGLSELPRADAALRDELTLRARRDGWPVLHAELARLDPATAARLDPLDAQRIQRALEVCMLSGGPMSALLGARTEPLPYRTVAISIEPADRAWLHERIAGRFDAMLAEGLVAELSGLRARHALTPDLPSMRCVGYRQAWQYIDGDIDAPGLRGTGIAATRQLAKRQLTWLRGMDGLVRFDCMATDLRAQVRAHVAQALRRRA